MNSFPINQNNRDIIQFQINQKTQYDVPFYATKELAQSTITDMDEFPYKRFFRGEYANPCPVVFEREAGWRPLHNACYQKIGHPQLCDPHYCWQFPCSTVWPCRPNQELMKKQVDMGQEVCASRCNIQDRMVPTAP